MKMFKLIIIFIAFVILLLTLRKAILANEISIFGIIPPYYEVNADGNTLNITTNMRVIVNGERLK